jgi:hypothetical protein
MILLRNNRSSKLLYVFGRPYETSASASLLPESESHVPTFDALIHTRNHSIHTGAMDVVICWWAKPDHLPPLVDFFHHAILLRSESFIVVVF